MIRDSLSSATPKLFPFARLLHDHRRSAPMTRGHRITDHLCQLTVPKRFCSFFSRSGKYWRWGPHGRQRSLLIFLDKSSGDKQRSHENAHPSQCYLFMMICRPQSGGARAQLRSYGDRRTWVVSRQAVRSPSRPVKLLCCPPYGA